MVFPWGLAPHLPAPIWAVRGRPKRRLLARGAALSRRSVVIWRAATAASWRTQVEGVSTLGSDTHRHTRRTDIAPRETVHDGVQCHCRCEHRRVVAVWRRGLIGPRLVRSSIQSDPLHSLTLRVSKHHGREEARGFQESQACWFERSFVRSKKVGAAGARSPEPGKRRGACFPGL